MYASWLNIRSKSEKKADAEAQWPSHILVFNAIVFYCISFVQPFALWSKFITATLVVGAGTGGKNYRVYKMNVADTLVKFTATRRWECLANAGNSG